MAKYEQIQLRRDSTLNWQASNPRLALGEVGIDMDLLRAKVGNGIDRWNELSYMDDAIYQELDTQQRNTADIVREIISQIAANKKEASTNLESTRTNLQTQITRNKTDAANSLESTRKNLQEQITANRDNAASSLESTRQNLQTQITENKTDTDSGIEKLNVQVYKLESRQGKYEETLTGQLEQTKSEVQSKLDEIKDTRDTLNLRMDVIAGQATEDTEILDARIDADNIVHPNLGHNIRSTQQKLNDNIGDLSALQNSLTLKDEHLQEQVDTLAELAMNEADRRNTREKELAEEISTETQARTQDTADLKKAVQNEESARKSADNNVLATVRAEIDANLVNEQSSRLEHEDFLQEQINDASEGILENTERIHELNTKYKYSQAIQDEKIDSLGEQADDLANGIINLVGEVYRQYAKSKETLQRELAQRDAELERLREQIADVTNAALMLAGIANDLRVNKSTQKETDTLKARLTVIEEALTDGGLLIPSDNPPKTDAEIDDIIDDALSGELEPDDSQDTDDDREFYNELDDVFSGNTDGVIDSGDEDFEAALDDAFNS